MKKIAVFQSDLKVGGIQKSLVNFLSMLPSEEFEIDVFLYDRDVFYDLSQIGENVHFHFLKPYAYWNRFIYFRILRLFHRRKLSDKKYDLAGALCKRPETGYGGFTMMFPSKEKRN